MVARRPGCVFELGLGSGRTYDHLRELFAEREIFAFDRAISAHPKCIPDGDHMIFGEIRDTLQFCGPRIPGKPAFIHVDLGSGDPTQDLITRSWLSPLVADWTGARLAGPRRPPARRPVSRGCRAPKAARPQATPPGD